MTQTKTDKRFEAHQERLQFEAAIAEGKSVYETLTGEAITLIFIALGTKALREHTA